MNAIHIIMATSTSANPHDVPNERIETIVRKRKISAFTFFVFGILLIVAGALLASFESQRFSVSFIVFGVLGIMFAIMYWASAQRILIALKKFNAERTRQARLHAQNSALISFVNVNNGDYDLYANSIHVGLPSYEQSVAPPPEALPPYEEAIKTDSMATTSNNSSHLASATPIHSISLSVDQAESVAAPRELPHPKAST